MTATICPQSLYLLRECRQDFADHFQPHRQDLDITKMYKKGKHDQSICASGKSLLYNVFSTHFYMCLPSDCSSHYLYRCNPEVPEDYQMVTSKVDQTITANNFDSYN